MGNSTSSNDDEYEYENQDDEQQHDNEHENDNENDNDEYAKQFDGIDTLGYRVLGVQPDSPASKAGLVSFFDFIVGANEKMLLGSGEHLIEGEEYDDIDFPLLLQEASESKTSVTLLVWNIKIQQKRIVQLYPNRNWGGAGLLGVTIKLDNYGGADERLVRVLEIMEDHDKSPAFLAGLQPMNDFLLGTTSTTLTSTDILSTILQCNINQILELYVYNTTTDVVRIVTLHPTYNWGNGNSILGAVLGTGYLHRLPQSCRITIGKSIERKVSINTVDNNMNLSQDDIKIEPTLEMEIDDDYDDDDDDDVGLAASNHYHQERTRQPHQLGMRTTTTNNSGMDDSMRSISLEQQSSSEQEEHTESDSGRRSQTSQQQQQQRPDPPPSTAERIELAVTVAAAAATQHKQGQLQHDDPTSVKKIPSFTNAILNFVAPIPIPDADKTTTTTVTTTSGPPAAVPPAVSELLPPLPSKVADTAAVAATAAIGTTAAVQVSPPTQTKTFVVEQPPIVSVRPSSPSQPEEETEKITAVLFDSPPSPPPKVMDQLPVTSLSSFPSAAPVAVVVDPLPLPQQQQQQQFPPPPTTITGSAPFPPPPPAQMDTPPTPPPPPPPPAASPDPPSKHNDEDDYDDDDDDGSEYTDGSYTDDEYTDGEESPIKGKKTTGFLASFMPPPPKMEY